MDPAASIRSAFENRFTDEALSEFLWYDRFRFMLCDALVVACCRFLLSAVLNNIVVSSLILAGTRIRLVDSVKRNVSNSTCQELGPI